MLDMACEGEPRLAAAEYGRMGPQPDLSITVLADLGLSDETIGDYFGIGVEQIVALRTHARHTSWRVVGR